MSDLYNLTWLFWRFIPAYQKWTLEITNKQRDKQTNRRDRRHYQAALRACYVMILLSSLCSLSQHAPQSGLSQKDFIKCFQVSSLSDLLVSYFVSPSYPQYPALTSVMRSLQSLHYVVLHVSAPYRSVQRTITTNSLTAVFCFGSIVVFTTRFQVFQKVKKMPSQ